MQSSDPLGQHWGYTARFHDAETGLTYFRARYQDPATGRFLQRDPKGYRFGGGLYEYTASRPTSLVDPHGLSPWGGWYEDWHEKYCKALQAAYHATCEFAKSLGGCKSTDWCPTLMLKATAWTACASQRAMTSAFCFSDKTHDQINENTTSAASKCWELYRRKCYTPPPPPPPPTSSPSYGFEFEFPEVETEDVVIAVGVGVLVGAAIYFTGGLAAFAFAL